MPRAGYIRKMSQHDRWLRRRQVAHAVRDEGITPKQAGERFGFTRCHAAMSCREFGVLLPSRGRPAVVTWAAVDWSRPVAEIARRLGVTDSAVYHQRKKHRVTAAAA